MASVEDKIDAYLLGEMRPAEREQFEEKLTSDPGLAALLEDRKNTVGVIEALNDRQLRRQVKRIHAINRKPGNNNIHWMVPIVAVAASVAIFCFIQWFNPVDPISPNQLYTEYYEQPSLNFINRDEQTSEALVALSQAMNRADFEEAIQLLEAMKKVSREDLKINYALGICFLEVNRFKEALSHFNLILDKNDPMYVEEVRWYKAMALLKKGDQDSANVVLENIAAQSGAWHAEEAREILDGLNK